SGHESLLLRRFFEKAHERDRRDFPCHDAGRAPREQVGKLREIDRPRGREPGRVVVGPADERLTVVVAAAPSAPTRTACAPSMDDGPGVGGKPPEPRFVDQRKSIGSNDALPEECTLRWTNETRRRRFTIGGCGVLPQPLKPTAPRQHDRRLPYEASCGALRT